MKVLALDYGAARIGVAMGDTLQHIAFPRGVIAAKTAFADIAALCGAENVELIVVGLPLTLQGEVGHQAKDVQGFAEALRAATGIEVRFVDERLTSSEAVARARESGRSIDEIAAVIILETFFRTFDVET